MPSRVRNYGRSNVIRGSYWVVVNGVDNHFHEMYLVRLHLGLRVGQSAHCHFDL